jgi:hypothetical protein
VSQSIISGQQQQESIIYDIFVAIFGLEYGAAIKYRRNRSPWDSRLARWHDVVFGEQEAF